MKSSADNSVNVGNLEDIIRSVNDPSRLKVVRSSKLTKERIQDKVFTELSKAASKLLGTPMALISLVDSDRDVVAGQEGFPSDFAPEGSHDSLPSFCQLTVTNDRPLAINDAQAVPTLRLFPSVTTKGIRAHLGIPLHIDGQPVGNCCVFDFKPRQWTQDDIDKLSVLAEQATAQLKKYQE